MPLPVALRPPLEVALARPVARSTGWPRRSPNGSTCMRSSRCWISSTAPSRSSPHESCWALRRPRPAQRRRQRSTRTPRPTGCGSPGCGREGHRYFPRMRDPVFAALTAQITAVEDALTPDRVREIVAGEFQQLPVARRTLDLLVASPGLLTAADPTSPPALARLLLRLVEAGARTIQAPGCVLCGQQRPLPRQLPSGRACNACSRRLTRRQGSCRRCGHTRVLKAGPDGIEYCLRCWKDMKPDSTDRIIIEVRRHRRIRHRAGGPPVAVRAGPPRPTDARTPRPRARVVRGAWCRVGAVRCFL